MYVQKKTRKPWNERDPELVIYHDGDGLVATDETFTPERPGDLPEGAVGAISVWFRKMNGHDETYIQDQTSEIDNETKAMAIRAGKNSRLKVVRLTEHVDGYAVEGPDGNPVPVTEISGKVYDAMDAWLTRVIATRLGKITEMKEEASGE